MTNKKGEKPYKIKVFRHFLTPATSQIRTGDPFITSEGYFPLKSTFVGIICEKSVIFFQKKARLRERVTETGGANKEKIYQQTAGRKSIAEAYKKTSRPRDITMAML